MHPSVSDVNILHRYPRVFALLNSSIGRKSHFRTARGWRRCRCRKLLKTEGPNTLKLKLKSDNLRRSKNMVYKSLQKVYRKPTHTNQYLSFTSHHSTSSKQSVITALFNRAENFITNNTELKQEQQHITKVLQSNGYSKQFIDKTRRQWHLKQQNRNNNQPAEKESEPVRRINLPYIQSLSEQYQRTLSQHNIKSTFYTATTLRKILPSPKDPISTEKKHNIIYKLDCKDCDAVYIGESKRAYQTRIGEHISAVRKADTKRYETARPLLEIQAWLQLDRK